MNFEKIRNSVAQRVQIQPPALFIVPEGGTAEAVDDDWIIVDVRADRLTLENDRTKHQAVLGPDHGHHYTSNPGRSTDKATYGFLTLNVQVLVRGADVAVRPTRPGEPLAYTVPQKVRSGLERAEERARRQRLEAETRELLRRDTNAFRKVASELIETLVSSAQGLGARTGIPVSAGFREQSEVVVFMESVTLQLLVRKLYLNSAADAHYLIRFFDGRLLTPDELTKGLMLLEDPKELSRDTIAPTRTGDDEWGWTYGGTVLGAAELAGILLEKLVELRDT